MLLLDAALLLLAALLGGKMARAARLPALLGMIAGGAVLAHLPLPWGHEALTRVAGEGRLAVLAIVLLRAGLALAGNTLREAGPLAVRLGSVPLTLEALVVAAGAYLWLDLSAPMALLLGFLVGAISPAIVIPGMLDLIDGRHGKAKRTPVALLAGAPIDNIIAVVAIGVALDAASGRTTGYFEVLGRVLQSVVGGAGLGVVLGLTVALALGRFGSVAPWFLASLLWIVACALIPIGRSLGISFVLATIAAAAALRWRAPRAAAEAGLRLKQSFEVAQLALFGLIGFSMDLGPLSTIGPVAVLIIFGGQLGRAAGALLATTGSGLPARERVAAMLSYVPKATIQAAFGAVALDQGHAGGDIVLSVAVLAIIGTAPLGILAIHRGADRLLPQRSTNPLTHSIQLAGTSHLK